MNEINTLANFFHEKFGSEALIVQAPGRINIIGEHTDYNDGFVLPAAINKSVKLAIQKSGSSDCKLIAIDIDDEYSFSIDEDLKPIEKQWANYFLGVMSELKNSGAELSGFNLMFTSDIPIGAGLSSSAAIECGVGYALNQLFDLGISRMDLALIGQRAEHEFTGVKCGIMDQFASIMGKEGYVMQLDCRSLEFEYFPADFAEYQIVLFDTQVKHNLADTEYNIRRTQCEKALEVIQGVNPGASSLRDTTMEQLNTVKGQMEPIIYNRAKYVIDENNRVLEVSNLLKARDIKNVGRLMFETHKGLKDLYEVSCKELDLLVNLVKKHPAVVGARMMGGGFGGCTINLIKSTEANEIIVQVEKEYNALMDIDLIVQHVIISEGVKQIN